MSWVLTCCNVNRSWCLLCSDGLVATRRVTSMISRIVGSIRPRLSFPNVSDSRFLVSASGTSRHAYRVTRWCPPSKSSMLNIARYVAAITSMIVRTVDRTAARSSVLNATLLESMVRMMHRYDSMTTGSAIMFLTSTMTLQT